MVTEKKEKRDARREGMFGKGEGGERKKESVRVGFA